MNTETTTPETAEPTTSPAIAAMAKTAAATSKNRKPRPAKAVKKVSPSVKAKFAKVARSVEAGNARAAAKTAESKKAPKPAAKPVKPAAKAAVVAGRTKAGHRFDYKPGTRVKTTLRNGAEVTGRTVPYADQANFDKGYAVADCPCAWSSSTGAFVLVDIGDKKTPNVTTQRPATVKPY